MKLLGLYGFLSNSYVKSLFYTFIYVNLKNEDNYIAYKTLKCTIK